MKALLTTLLLIITLHSFGQADFRLDSSRKTIDSLYEKLNVLAKLIRKTDTDIPAPPDNYNYKIINFDNDSSAIYFSNVSGELLYRMLNRYDKKGFKLWEVSEIYKSSGKLSYSEGWNWSCLMLPANNDPDPDVMHYVALLYEKARFTYDSLGRIKERVWWYAPLGDIRKYTYTYDSNNNQTYQRTQLDESLFWE
ncbi:hypothetical protein OCK74_18760 [Chitinophagaceae bacterium LB-8]|uniref:Uncharacterized protein n=1 Tax=Paraflavisolibacter caeni TaxID=2982496 RepID=A0A9X3BGM1_9BACT|nr:hypothetical protein [Paraflavisolibacter caeni]MCU7551169.1 hypothetical protein [Paraflavisolibacter caeni]